MSMRFHNNSFTSIIDNNGFGIVKLIAEKISISNTQFFNIKSTNLMLI